MNVFPGTQNDSQKDHRMEASALAASHHAELLKVFIEHSPAAIAMLDTKMHYLLASKRWLADFGLLDQSLNGRSHYEVFPDIPDRWRLIHQRCLAGAVESCAD